MWRRHKLETHGRSEIEMVQVDAERVQIVPCVGRALNRCGGSQIHVAIHVEIIVVVRRHSRRGMRKLDCGGDQREQ
jgi:hypothetical protein